MNWSSPYVIFRIADNGQLIQVHSASDLKSAKYWLTYIAQCGDVLCNTPVHPKHSKSSQKPEYWSHKQASGSPATSFSAWKEMVHDKNANPQFPECQSS